MHQKQYPHNAKLTPSVDVASANWTYDGRRKCVGSRQDTGKKITTLNGADQQHNAEPGHRKREASQ